jgi:hypothetical protein
MFSALENFTLGKEYFTHLFLKKVRLLLTSDHQMKGCELKEALE